MSKYQLIKSLDFLQEMNDSISTFTRLLGVSASREVGAITAIPMCLYQIFETWRCQTVLFVRNMLGERELLPNVQCMASWTHKNKNYLRHEVYKSHWYCLLVQYIWRERERRNLQCGHGITTYWIFKAWSKVL